MECLGDTVFVAIPKAVIVPTAADRLRTARPTMHEIERQVLQAAYLYVKEIERLKADHESQDNMTLYHLARYDLIDAAARLIDIPVEKRSV